MATISDERLKLWFFRDISSEQRLKLFALMQMPVDEIGDTHGHQQVAFRHIVQSLRSQAGVSDADDDNASKWRENVEHLLSTGDPDVIRCHEGGGPESLIGSLVLTMMRTRNARDKALTAALQGETK